MAEILECPTVGAGSHLVEAVVFRANPVVPFRILRDTIEAPQLVALVVAADVGAKLARALMATPTALLNPGNVDAGARYDMEGIQYLGQFAGLSLYVSGAALGGSPLLSNGTALLGSASVAKMMYGPTYLPMGEQAMERFVGRRSVYSIVNRDPVAIANVIQSAPLPLVRRKWDVLYIKGLSS